MRLSYALGRRLEDDAQAGESFACYARGAAIARRRGAALIDHRAHAAQVARVFTADFFAARAGWGVDDAAPIFVVGLPRSGSTLVEQILASHAAVEGTMELSYMGAIAARVGDGAEALTRAEVRALGEDYLARAAIHRRLGRPRFVDKMPNNFRHVGLIRLILPRATIIDVRRAPMATCFSCFKQLFAEGQDHSYDLGDLGRYYRYYLTIMRHMTSVQPDAVHRVIYEDLVEATEVEVRRLVAAAGLPFDHACLRFFENDRAVRTVSSEQVRQPIYRSGLDHWTMFAPWLGALRIALGDAIDDWRS
ncbi:MAG: sulfotransferase [Sphingomonas adhaesiva]